MCGQGWCIGSWVGVIDSLSVGLRHLGAWLLCVKKVPSAAVDGAYSKHKRYGGCFISVTGRKPWLGKNLTMAIMIAPTESYKSYDTLASVLKHNFSGYKSILDKSYIIWSDRDKGKYTFMIITR